MATPTRRIALSMSTVFVVVAIALTALNARVSPSIEGLPWWSLIPAFWIAEVLVVHIRAGSQKHTISFADAPLIIGLAYLSIPALVAARLTGSLVALTTNRHAERHKTIFNLSLFTLETAAAAAVYHSILGGAAPTSRIGWVAGLAAALTMAGIGIAAVRVIIRLTAGTAPNTTRTAVLSCTATIVATSATLGAMSLQATTPFVGWALIAGISILALTAHRLTPAPITEI